MTIIPVYNIISLRSKTFNGIGHGCAERADAVNDQRDK